MVEGLQHYTEITVNPRSKESAATLDSVSLTPVNLQDEHEVSLVLNALTEHDGLSIPVEEYREMLRMVLRSSAVSVIRVNNQAEGVIAIAPSEDISTVLISSRLQSETTTPGAMTIGHLKMCESIIGKNSLLPREERKKLRGQKQEKLGSSTSLFEKQKEKLKEHPIIANVKESNDQSLRLYTRLGFQEISHENGIVQLTLDLEAFDKAWDDQEKLEKSATPLPDYVQQQLPLLLAA